VTKAPPWRPKKSDVEAATFKIASVEKKRTSATRNAPSHLDPAAGKRPQLGFGTSQDHWRGTAGSMEGIRESMARTRRPDP